MHTHPAFRLPEGSINSRYAGSFGLQTVDTDERRTGAASSAFHTLFVEFNKKYFVDRNLSVFIPESQALLDRGKAISFYILTGAFQLINVASTLIKVITKNWFNRTAQILLGCVLGLDLIRMCLAYRESQYVAKIGKSLLARSLDTEASYTQSEKDCYASFAKMLLAGQVRDKLIRGIAAVGSLVGVVSEVLPLFVEFEGKQVVPISDKSPPIAVASMVLGTFSSMVGIPFLTMLAIQTIGKVIKTYKIRNLLQDLEVCDHFVNMVHHQQRFKELILRASMLALGSIGLTLLTTWSFLQMFCIRQNPDTENSFWAMKSANALNLPMLFSMSLQSLVAMANACIKMVWDHRKSCNHQSLKSALLAEKIVDEAAPLTTTDKPSLEQQFASEDLVFSIYSMLTTDQGRDGLENLFRAVKVDRTAVAHFSGIADEFINADATTPPDPSKLDALCYRIASDLGLIDVV